MERILKANFSYELLLVIARDNFADPCIIRDLKSERPLVGEPLIELLNQRRLKLRQTIVNELVNYLLRINLQSHFPYNVLRQSLPRFGVEPAEKVREASLGYL